MKLKSKKDLGEVSAMLLGRARQAHHGIEDVEIDDLEAEGARSWQNFLNQMHGWTVVLMSLAGTVLLVGGVGVLSVMLISFSDRRYEIGLRKAMGASDGRGLRPVPARGLRARGGRRVGRHLLRRGALQGAFGEVSLRPRRQSRRPRHAPAPRRRIMGALEVTASGTRMANANMPTVI